MFYTPEYKAGSSFMAFYQIACPAHYVNCMITGVSGDVCCLPCFWHLTRTQLALEWGAGCNRPTPKPLSFLITLPCLAFLKIRVKSLEASGSIARTCLLQPIKSPRQSPPPQLPESSQHKPKGFFCLFLLCFFQLPISATHLLTCTWSSFFQDSGATREAELQ